MVSWSRLTHSLISSTNLFHFYGTCHANALSYIEKESLICLLSPPRSMFPLLHAHRKISAYRFYFWMSYDFHLAILQGFQVGYPILSDIPLGFWKHPGIWLNHLKSIGQTVVLKFSEKPLRLDICETSTIKIIFLKIR